MHEGVLTVQLIPMWVQVSFFRRMSCDLILSSVWQKSLARGGGGNSKPGRQKSERLRGGGGGRGGGGVNKYPLAAILSFQTEKLSCHC